MFHKDNSTVAAIVAQQQAQPGGGGGKGGNKGKKGGGGGGRGGGGGGGGKKQLQSQSQSQSQQPAKKKIYKDVPLRKSDRKRLRDRAEEALFGGLGRGGSASGDDGEAAKGDPPAAASGDDAPGGDGKKDPLRSLLDDVFLNGMLVSRNVDLPLPSSAGGGSAAPIELRKATLYYRSPSADDGAAAAATGNRADTATSSSNGGGDDRVLLTFWPYVDPGQQQCVWMHVEGNDANNRRYEWEVPSLALLSVLPPVETATTATSSGVLGRVFLKSPAVTKYLCRGAHLMRAGMLADGAASPVVGSSSFGSQPASVVAVCVVGNPQPMAVGLYHPPTSDPRSQQEGRGVTILTCYGDDFWRQQRQHLKAGSAASRGSNSRGSVVSPYGAPYGDGNYGNVGFVDGKYVVPIINDDGGGTSQQQQVVDEEWSEKEGEGKEANEPKPLPADNRQGGEADNGAEQDDGSQVAANANATSGSLPDPPVVIENNESTPSSEQIFHEAVCKALASLHPKKQYLPMAVATFYAKHVLQQEGEIPSIKATRYKKLNNYLSEQVETGLIAVGPDKSSGSSKGKGKNQPPPDPMALLIDYNRQHPDVRQHCLLSGVEDANISAASEGSTTRLALIDLYCVPAHVSSLLRLDLDAVKAANATSAERRGTGMLTIQEMRALLDEYVKQNQLVDSLNSSDVILDGPLTDALFPKSKKNNKSQTVGNEQPPTSLSRQDLVVKWKQRMEPAYALVQVPGSAVLALGRGSPPTVTIEVTRRQSKKFVTKVSGNMQHYGVNPGELAQQVSHRFACAAVIEEHASTNLVLSSKASADKASVVIQGNLSDELLALLMGDEKLTSHGGAKASPYRLPKKAVQVVLRKGVPSSSRGGKK